MRFGARRAAIELAAQDWDTPLRGADFRLLAALSGMVGVKSRDGDPLLVSVRALANQALPGSLTLGAAAAALACNCRTLQRRLATSKTSLRRLVDEARRDRAEQLAAQGDLSLGEVATRLGFAEAASFTRAWQRWFGVAPSRDLRLARPQVGLRNRHSPTCAAETLPFHE